MSAAPASRAANERISRWSASRLLGGISFPRRYTGPRRSTGCAHGRTYERPGAPVPSDEGADVAQDRVPELRVEPRDEAPRREDVVGREATRGHEREVRGPPDDRRVGLLLRGRHLTGPEAPVPAPSAGALDVHLDAVPGEIEPRLAERPGEHADPHVDREVDRPVLVLGPESVRRPHVLSVHPPLDQPGLDQVASGVLAGEPREPLLLPVVLGE